MGDYILKYSIPQKIINLAKTEALNTTLNRSITNGKRNVMGTIGELCYLVLLDSIYDTDLINYNPTYDYDVILQNLKIDVKSKQRNVPPQPNYDASIVAYSQYLPVV